MYSPKIGDDLIPQLYRLAKGLNMPMTRLVNALLAHGIARVEQGIEKVNDILADEYPRKKRTKRRAQYGKPDRKSSVP